MLEYQNLTIRNNNRLVLDHLNTEAAPGSIYGILGPDTDAKTMFLRTAAAIVFPDEGDVLLEGDSVFEKMNGAWMKYGYMSSDHVFFHKLKLSAALNIYHY